MTEPIWAAVDCAPQVATALADPGTVLRGSEAVALAQASGRARI